MTATTTIIIFIVIISFSSDIRTIVIDVITSSTACNIAVTTTISTGSRQRGLEQHRQRQWVSRQSLRFTQVLEEKSTRRTALGFGVKGLVASGV